MNKIKQILKTKTTWIALLATVIIVVAGLNNYRLNEKLYAQKQDAIQATPWDVVEMFQEAGYTLSDIKDPELDEISGKYGDVEEFIVVHIDEYRLLIFSYQSWQTARNAVKIGQTYSFCDWYAFHYGPVVVEIVPDDEDFGKELLSVLESGE